MFTPFETAETRIRRATVLRAAATGARFFEHLEDGVEPAQAFEQLAFHASGCPVGGSKFSSVRSPWIVLAPGFPRAMNPPIRKTDNGGQPVLQTD